MTRRDHAAFRHDDRTTLVTMLGGTVVTADGEHAAVGRFVGHGEDSEVARMDAAMIRVMVTCDIRRALSDAQYPNWFSLTQRRGDAEGRIASASPRAEFFKTRNLSIRVLFLVGG